MVSNPKDLPESILIGWIACLSLFNLKVVHVLRTENTITDALTRRESCEDCLRIEESSDEEKEIYANSLAMTLPNTFQLETELVLISRYLTKGVVLKGLGKRATSHV
jgi:hypothetical protein